MVLNSHCGKSYFHLRCITYSRYIFIFENYYIIFYFIKVPCLSIVYFDKNMKNVTQKNAYKSVPENCIIHIIKNIYFLY